MAKVFTSEATGAVVYVFSDDHCPPHVHARHRGDGWVARAGFSFPGHTVELWSIQPIKRTPPQRAVNRLLDDVEGRLPEYDAEAERLRLSFDDGVSEEVSLRQ